MVQKKKIRNKKITNFDPRNVQNWSKNENNKKSVFGLS